MLIEQEVIKGSIDNIYSVGVIILNENINEYYAKDGKELINLVQEWIDENSSYLYSIFSNQVIDSKYR